MIPLGDGRDAFFWSFLSSLLTGCKVADTPWFCLWSRRFKIRQLGVSSPFWSAQAGYSLFSLISLIEVGAKKMDAWWTLVVFTGSNILISVLFVILILFRFQCSLYYLQLEEEKGKTRTDN
ncbi:hypothetical protein QBC36DRAFT_106887 [Triangularia setosa]|uniref:Uncharacterized protein n=1 Tax=Triangularia setosa TaxID=2587417 RepID=A0AAN6WGZ0_9PEZI|nr:hypothetical protein QBC36DRAFT_106887 [Podospora setosa]